MEFLIALAFLLGVILLIKTFTRYDPNIDLVLSNNKYVFLLWYNKYDSDGKYEGRTYIKLFEI